MTTWQKRIEEDSTTAVAKDGASNGTGTTIAGAGAKSSDGKQLSTEKTTAGTAGAAKQLLQQKSANATDMAGRYKSCESDVKQACEGNLAQLDKQQSEQATKACEAGAKASTAVAADKAGAGMDMGQLGQLASQAAGALGQLMQGQQKKDSGSGSSMDPTSSTYTDPYASNVASTDGSGSSATDNGANSNSSTIAGLDDKNGTRTANSVGFTGINPAAIGDKKAAASGTGTPGAGANPGSGGASSSDHAQILAGTQGSDPGYGSSSGGGFSGGSAGFSGGGGSSSGAGGSADASGASRYDPNAKAASDAYEIPGGGGGGGSRFLGLKSKNGELSELDGALGSADGHGLDLASLGDDAGRDPASEEEQGAGVHGEDGTALFSVIHSKLVEIRKRGNI